MAEKYNTVSRRIEAPPEVIWGLLTDSSGYRDWNPAVVSLEGEIADGETIELVSAVNPDRGFKLKVSTDAPTSMVWRDGMPLGLFKGVRTFNLEPVEGGTDFSMTEVFSGPLAGMISKAIPDLQESFEQFASGLKDAAESDSR